VAQARWTGEAAAGRVVRREGISDEQVLQAVEAHRRAMSGDFHGGQVLKRDAKTNVTVVAWDGVPSGGTQRVCVKEFVRSGARRLLPGPMRHRPAQVAWRAASRLAALGIGAPRGLGLLIGRGASSYLVMTVLENSEHLAAYARRAMGRSAPLERKNAFLRSGAAFLRRCYASGVFHRDLKAGNLFVQEAEARSDGPFPRSEPRSGTEDAAQGRPDSGRTGGWEFSLLDLADVRFPRRIRLQDKLLNLAQLNASTPIEITWADRLRFLRHLAEEMPELADRAATAEIARLTRSRRCVWAQ